MKEKRPKHTVYGLGGKQPEVMSEEWERMEWETTAFHY